ncbi:MAG: Spo0E family sporulation regulatory protein-aspartic acid phosphatase [Bacillota bacterium]
MGILKAEVIFLNKEELLKAIENLRAKMIEMNKDYVLNDKEIVEISQKIDKLLNEYEKLIKKNDR